MVAPTAVKPTATHPFTGRDVPWLLATQAAARAEHPFLVWEPFDGDGYTWTYREFAEAVARVAAGLADHGVTAGDRVLVHLGNCPEFLAAWFACSHLGAVVVTTNTRSTADEVAVALVATGLGPVFATTVSFADVSRGKPDPEGYLLGAQRLGVPPAACLVVEDSPVGAAAGQAAGMGVIFHPQAAHPDPVAAAPGARYLAPGSALGALIAHAMTTGDLV